MVAPCGFPEEARENHLFYSHTNTISLQQMLHSLTNFMMWANDSGSQKHSTV